MSVNLDVREIPGFPRYFCGRDGTVYSNKTKTRALRTLKCPIATHGYKMVHVRSNGGDRNLLVHRLVAATWVEPVLGRTHVNHMNGDRLDNRAENLEYVTPQENLAHSREVLGNSVKGERHPNARLTAEDVRAIRRMHAELVPYAQIAAKYGIARDYAYEVANKKKWRHID